MSSRPEPAVLELVASGELDRDLVALLWLLAERGVPLVVASLDAAAAERFRTVLGGAVRAAQPALDAIAGGVVMADSLEDVLRLAGGPATGQLVDEARDLGVVVVHDGRRVRSAHYIRQIERDAAGHLQRRPPALLAAWNADLDVIDHFHWSITDELATRSGMTRDDFERELARRIEQLGGDVVGSRPWH